MAIDAERSLIKIDTSIVQESKAAEAVQIINGAHEAAMAIVSKYGFMEVFDDASKVGAENALVEVRTIYQDFDKRRKAWCSQFDRTQRGMNAAVRDNLEPLLTIDMKLSAQLSAHTRAVNEKHREAQAEALRKAAEEAAAAAAKGEVPDIPELVVPEVPKPEMAKAEGVSYRTDWKFEVLEASKVPSRFWIVDYPTIIAAVKAGTREIPGVRIWSEQVPVRKGR